VRDSRGRGQLWTSGRTGLPTPKRTLPMRVTPRFRVAASDLVARVPHRLGPSAGPAPSHLSEDPGTLLLLRPGGSFCAFHETRSLCSGPDSPSAATNNSRAQWLRRLLGTYTVDDAASAVTQRLLAASRKRTSVHTHARDGSPRRQTGHPHRNLGRRRCRRHPHSDVNRVG